VKNSPGKVRLGDDVTKENRDLITRLLEHDSITSAWYLITRLLKHDSVTSAWYLITRLLEHDSVTSAWYLIIRLLKHDNVTSAWYLITRLLEHDSVTPAWYFNGSDYGSVKGKRVKFDILYDIDLKVRKIRGEKFHPPSIPHLVRLVQFRCHNSKEQEN
jgi:hypothetical protein